ncbi:cytochrome P450 [Fistulina hepatica ATCC 64428]|uniref:Cytochrome P450 n=1 Tax=Fistulina hepatica ATCC 64428 TaxID=1128425 RepID=A0A0D7AP78_9AGAR|nr:cytochrome P450 [Fistulina hepatica ATCC 64428]
MFIDFLAICIGLTALLFIGYRKGASWITHKSLKHIPSVNFSRFGSWGDAFMFLTSGHRYISRGCEMYPNAVFKVRRLDGWICIVNGSLIEELQAMPSSVASLHLAAHETLRGDYTLGSQITFNSYHIPLVSRLTRNLNKLYQDIFNEIQDTLVTHIGDASASINATRLITDVVGRTSNRIFVGDSLCRNEKYVSLNIRFAAEVMKVSTVLNLCPKFIRPFVSRLFSNIPDYVEAVTQLLTPIITARLDMREKYGAGHDGEPLNDELISQGDERAPHMLARRILALNFAAIHTSSISMLHALYHFTANQEYVKELRAEIDRVVNESGWSLESISSMHLLDSFLRESQRYEGLGPLSMTRKALQPFSLSNGTYIPAGTLLYVPSNVVHQDPRNYSNPEVFDPWRYVDKGGSGSRLEFTRADPTYLPFGLGRHACPGRFFAACEIKTTLAYILHNYDVAFDDGIDGRPDNLSFFLNTIPSPYAKIRFSKRF